MPPRPRRPKFPYDLPYQSLNLREHPELYRIGLGEQGVLLVQPYKSELLPHWRFKTPQIAKQSSTVLFQKFCEYRDAEDFVGCDMARKFVQMGVTRSRRYANYKGGRKYTTSEDGVGRVAKERGAEDPIKAESARVFMGVLDMIKQDEEYKRLEKVHRDLYDAEEINLNDIASGSQEESD